MNFHMDSHNLWPQWKRIANNNKKLLNCISLLLYFKILIDQHQSTILYTRTKWFTIQFDDKNLKLILYVCHMYGNSWKTIEKCYHDGIEH